ncbi:MAG: hypothetical protein V3S37_06325, partial [Dehalococcoidia bacterium]
MSSREVLRVLLHSGSGRMGSAFLVTLVLASVFVLVRFPLDFGDQRWNNPVEWADNPKAVPPAWTALLKGDQAVPHTVFGASKPTSVTSEAGMEKHLYSFTYEFDSQQPPSFMAFMLSDVRFESRP